MREAEQKLIPLEQLEPAKTSDEVMREHEAHFNKLSPPPDEKVYRAYGYTEIDWDAYYGKA